ncbi:MAG: protein kinase [Pseudomonadota bacterium]|nr:protein kinase [Pseudomonadota bacterium]
MLGPLGEGGFAQVWRVLDRRLNVQRAVKVVDATADRQAGERVLREAKLLAELGHGSIITVFDAFEDDGLACVVMELCAGSLADRVAASGPLSPGLAVRLGIDVLGALGAAHARGVVHRDIKPQNLLVTERGEVRVADFGIARFRDESVSITRTGALLGSVPFMAPEQRQDPSRVGVGADLYALATTLAWAMTGRPSGDLFVEAELARLGRLTGAGFAGVLARAGRYTPEERYASAEEMTEALRVVAASMPEPADDLHLTSDAHPSVRLRPRTPRWGLFTLALALVSAGALAFASRRAVALPELDTRDDIPPCPDGTTWFDETVRSGPREAMAAASADVDGDGKVDAVFTNQLDENLSIYWGNGRAMLEQGAEVPTVRSGSPVGVGDLDGDGHADLVVADRDGARLQVLPGKDGRTFDPPIEIFQSGIPAWPLPIDWDGDGQLDLALTLAACVAWRHGDGAAEFAPHQCLAPGPDVLGVAVVRSATSKVGLLLAGGAGWWVAHPDERAMIGTREEVFPARLALDMDRLSASAWDADGDGNDEIYGWADAPEAQVALRATRVGGAWSVCELGRIDARRSGPLPRAGADYDGDGKVDFLRVQTCAECTSNHVILRGR